VALISQFTDVSSANTIITLATGNDAFVGAGASLASEVTAISGLGSGHRVTVAGTVLGANAVRLGDSATADTDQWLVVAGTGQLLSGGGGAAYLQGQRVEVSNLGLIQGLFVDAGGPQSSNIYNAGRIESLFTALNITTADDMFVNNTGRITASQAVFSSGTGSVTIDNSSVMLGDLSLRSLDNKVTNAGTMRGDLRTGDGNDTWISEGRTFGSISLQDGDDRYEGVGAERVAGALRITGGEGNDEFVLGAAVENVEGDNGTDRLFLSGLASGATLFLDGLGDNAGSVAGESFFEIEQVFGTRFADRITGGTGAESLYGNTGADRLSGGGGADTLAGDLGADVLTGGAGNDTFFVLAPGQGADRITDFRNVAGNNDAVVLYAAGFGAGLSAGPLAPGQFRARADNAAQDANDRFIFRTTDKTLWFDANGNAAGGATLIADLQQTATFGLADIVLV
jgi:Ca2+-binding RTX toxin-like protein